jgi:branched-chain amino acid transport system permease protein
MTGMSMAARIAVGVAVLLLALLPVALVEHSYYINIASQVLIWAVFALALNIVVGYAGLTSLGHASLFGMAGYTTALMLEAGWPHVTAIACGLGATVAVSAVFAILALRATGIGFLMITLALGQILWGIAYRWASVTHGDNGVNVKSRPVLLDLGLGQATSFYYVTLAVFFVTVVAMLLLARSPLGAAVRGTRDQARRMSALGFNVWLIRFVAFLLSGFWTGVAGLLYVYYNQFVSPQVAALQTSAEALLMVISGGTSTLFGPIVGAALVVIVKNVVSAYIERWNLVLGVIFVLIVIFMPEGLVPGFAKLWRRLFFSADIGGKAGPAASPREAAR